MDKKNSNRNGRKNIFDDKRVTLVAALLIAIVCWVVVAGFVMPSGDSTIRGIEIDYAADAQAYQDRGLQMVGTPTENFAEVYVLGDGSQLGGLNQDDFHIWVDYSRVTQPGQQDVPIRVDKLSSATFNVADYSVRNSVYSLDTRIKDTVTVTFEVVQTQRFDILAKADGVTAADGYFRDAVTASTPTVNIRGPESNVNQVRQVVAEVTLIEERAENVKYQAVPLRLLNEQGEELDPQALDLTLSVETVDVDVTINEMRTIGLTVAFTGLPANLDTTWFYNRITLSDTELEVVGPTAAFENLSNPYPVATYDISQLSLGWESDPINILVPEGSGLRINDQLRYVSVSFDSSNLVEKTFEIPLSNIRVQNPPQNAQISPMVDSISVKLIGTAEQMNALLPENISVQIDAYGVSATTVGTQISLPARVRVPVADQCFAVGNYLLICDVQAME